MPNWPFKIYLTGVCEVTCLENSCQVRNGGAMGSCFLPPFPTKCHGLPAGCGSCVNECSGSGSSSGSNSGFGSSSQGIVYVVSIVPARLGLRKTFYWLCISLGMFIDDLGKKNRLNNISILQKLRFSKKVISKK